MFRGSAIRTRTVIGLTVLGVTLPFVKKTVMLDSVTADEIMVSDRVMRTTNRVMMTKTVVEVSRCFKNKTFHNYSQRVNKGVQELIQSDPYQAPNTKGKDRLIQFSNQKNEQMEAELATYHRNGNCKP